MSNSIVDYSDITAVSEIAKASGGKTVRPHKTAFLNAFLDYLPNSRTTFADQARARSEERKIILNQMLEKLRAESSTKQQALLSKLIQSDEDEKPYDIYSKCLEIAKKIMRGERVSAEEMRFLARYFPELLFQALLLRDDDPDLKEDDSQSEDNELLSVSSGRSESGAQYSADSSFL